MSNQQRVQFIMPL